MSGPGQKLLACGRHRSRFFLLHHFFFLHLFFFHLFLLCCLFLLCRSHLFLHRSHFFLFLRGCHLLLLGKRDAEGQGNRHCHGKRNDLLHVFHLLSFAK